jgi:hypothetical protein
MRRAVAISRAGGVRRVTPQRRCQWARGLRLPLSGPPSMFNFSANHLLLLSRTEYRTCVVLLMKDDSTRRVYRLYDFTKSQTPTSGQYYCVSGKVNSADKLYLVIKSSSRIPSTADVLQFLLLLTAREDSPWLDFSCTDKSRAHACPVSPAADAGVSPRPSPPPLAAPKPAKVAPFYPGASINAAEVGEIAPHD